MKKTLTQNISRYDNKIRLRYDLHTLRILLLSLAVGVGSGLLSGLLLPLIYSVGIGALTALIVFAVFLIRVNGIPLIRLLPLLLTPPDRRQYAHTALNPEDRLNPDQYYQEESERKNAKQKEK